jgi:hypothetical protein
VGGLGVKLERAAVEKTKPDLTAKRLCSMSTPSAFGRTAEYRRPDEGFLPPEDTEAESHCLLIGAAFRLMFISFCQSLFHPPTNAFTTSSSSQRKPSRIIALSKVSSFLMQATMTTFDALPAFFSRSANGPSTGFVRIAATVAM